MGPITIKRALLALFVVLLVGGACFYIYATQLQNIFESRKNSQNVADWRVYTSINGAFQFRYPERWHIYTDPVNTTQGVDYPILFKISMSSGPKIEIMSDSLGDLKGNRLTKQQYITKYYSDISTPNETRTSRAVVVGGKEFLVIHDEYGTAAKRFQASKYIFFDRDRVYTFSANFSSSTESVSDYTDLENIAASLGVVQVATIRYTNNQYGFTFSLPTSWVNYSIVTSEWVGSTSGPSGDEAMERGPTISIRHPQWTAQTPRQDIPVMIFTTRQWNDLQQDKFHIGAAPIGPSELGRNASYVFALPARYNYAFPAGYEEVEAIMKTSPLHAF